MWIVFALAHFEKHDFLGAPRDKELVEHEVHVSQTHIGAACTLDFELSFSTWDRNIEELTLSIESINFFIFIIVKALVRKVLY